MIVLCRSLRWSAAIAGVLGTSLLGAAAVAQQPTLRYSQSAARHATRAAAEEEVSENPIGAGVRQASHASPIGMPSSRLSRYQRTNAFAAEQIDPEVISAGERIVIDETAGHVHAGGDCDSCGVGGAGPRGYGRMYGGDPACGPCGVECCAPRLDTIELFVGGHGFTGPNNRGSGSFGFHEGINASMPFLCGLTVQGGYQATQSNFEGAFFTPDDRTQSFVTVGAFRRVDLGLQGGVVVDYLHDRWDCEIDLAQLRGELSWRMPCEHEFGFWFAAGLDRSNIVARDVQFATPGGDEDTITVTDGTFTVQPLDLYAFFYRKQLACGGEGRLFGGFADDSQGLLGMNLKLPVSTCLSLTTDFLYVIPSESSPLAFTEEAWNVSFNFVWTPCRRSNCGPNYCRPLFDVANNGSMIVQMQ